MMNTSLNQMTMTYSMIHQVPLHLTFKTQKTKDGMIIRTMKTQQICMTMTRNSNRPISFAPSSADR